jgi:putative transposase
MDRDGTEPLLQRTEGRFPRLKHLWLDAGYKGKAKEWVEKALGWTAEVVQHRLKIAPAKVMRVWARERAKEGVRIDWEKLLPPKGFRVLPRRWVVERTFSWLGQNRTLSKDYERLCETSEAFIYVAMIRLMVRHLARR